MGEVVSERSSTLWQRLLMVDWSHEEPNSNQINVAVRHYRQNARALAACSVHFGSSPVRLRLSKATFYLFIFHKDVPGHRS